MRISESQKKVCKQAPTIFKPNVLQLVHSSVNGVGITDPGKMKEQLVRSKLNYTEKNIKQEVPATETMNHLSPKLSYKVCIQHEVPQRSVCSVLFLDKSLWVSLAELGFGNVQPVSYRSTTSCRLGVPSQRKSATIKKLDKTNMRYGTGWAAMLQSNNYSGREDGLGHHRCFLSKHQNYEADQASIQCGVWDKANSSDRYYQRDYLRFYPIRTTDSNTRMVELKRNADGVDFISSDSETWRKQAGDKTDQEDGTSTETLSTCHYRCRLKTDSVAGILSLKEALEFFRPDFISRSQCRVRRMEQRARRRKKALQDSNPDLLQGIEEDQGKLKRNCTTPDPLSGKESLKKLKNQP
ncbi:putative LOC107375804-like protein [Nothobranchius furzeri]|uniref:LOC107375804-like protein n=1 Tax=Nothobranchius furzeri TaxID=105023 RepID=A0A9D2YI09_NOTFU|nr:putative LOC107375804-like protein [Nothobranchius furzeri]